MKRFSLKCIALKLDVIGAENILCACRRVRASFSPEVLQAGAVKGLIVCTDGVQECLALC